MVAENSVPRSNPQDPKNRMDAGSATIDAAGASAGGETTLDTGASAAATGVRKAVDRMTIGPYALIRILGEGGMGQVWLAEQTAPVRRKVALKLIKGGLYDSAVIQRFESERQSLAVMNHPTIAKVFDAGSTKDGQPYFVMEYVDGPPITRHCDTKKLKIRERLELFVKVCEGVQHAHQKAIIHRDLKPSNVLVEEVDGRPVPRIIDFGIAKAISSQPGAEQTQFTEMGALIGTRGFISPEQADPGVLDVDTRTDVYSLGALLYVLLTGMLPFDSEGGKKKPIDELLRQLREEDPPSPSAKVSTEKETATAAAATRGTEPGQLAKLLRGDLDWITMKAVEKDRARRYGTPSELAADIERYLENRPVVARPASRSYRLKKYAQRHRVGVAVTAGAAALLVAFGVAQSVQLHRTTLERDHATRERDRANRITQFMTSMFKVSDPSEARGNSVTAREILDKASKDIDTGLAKDPELQAQMMSVMGEVYSNLDIAPRAVSLFQRTVDVRQRVLGPRNPDTLISMCNLGWALSAQGHYAEAEKVLRQTVDMQRSVLGSEHPNTLLSMNYLAGTLEGEGRYPEAEKLERETLDVQRRVLGPEHRDTLMSANNLADILYFEGRYAEAEKLQRETLDIQRRVLGPEHPNTLNSMVTLDDIVQLQGRYAEAEKLYRDTLDIQRRVLGPEAANTLATMRNLAFNIEREGRRAEAEKLLRETLDIQRRVVGSEHPNTLTTMAVLAYTLGEEGRYEEQAKLYRETLQVQSRILGPEHPNTLNTMINLVATLIEEGHYSEAEKMDRETLAIQRRVLGPEHPDTAARVYFLGCIMAREGKPNEALSLLREAVDHGLPPDGDLSIEKNPNLKSLQSDPRFAALVAHAKERAAAARKPNQVPVLVAIASARERSPLKPKWRCALELPGYSIGVYGR